MAQIQAALQSVLSKLDEAAGKRMDTKRLRAGSDGNAPRSPTVDTGAIEAAVWGSTLEMLGQGKGGAGAGPPEERAQAGGSTGPESSVPVAARGQFARTDPLLPPPKGRDRYDLDGWSSDGGSSTGRRSAGLPRQRRLRAAKVAKPPSVGTNRDRRGFAGRSASPGGSGFKRTKWYEVYRNCRCLVFRPRVVLTTARCSK